MPSGWVAAVRQEIMKFIQYAIYWEKIQIIQKIPSEKINVKKKTFFLSQAPTLITVLLFICNSSMSWSTRFTFSLKVCVGFSIFDAILFLIKFIFTLREHQETGNLFFNWDSLHCKAEQPLQGMELQEKEA